MSVSLPLQPRAVQVAAQLEQAMNQPGEELAPAALAIARVEYPALETTPYLDMLDTLGEQAVRRLGNPAPSLTHDAIKAFNEFFYEELGFAGNRDRYDDPRNSFLNEVLNRRTGIPISLAVAYLEVSRRAGLRVAGVNFPGHFLMRTRDAAPSGGPSEARSAAASDDSEARSAAATDPSEARRAAALDNDVLIVDPFHAGALLSEIDCRELLRQHVGDETAFDRALLEPASRTHIVVRMLVNLKRLYVRMRSFPQARFISDLLLAVDPSAIVELRDRGLLAYHLQDFAGALRDLESYLRLLPKPHAQSSEAMFESPADDSDSGDGQSEQSEHEQIWEHVKTLRKRVAGFN